MLPKDPSYSYLGRDNIRDEKHKGKKRFLTGLLPCSSAASFQRGASREHSRDKEAGQDGATADCVCCTWFEDDTELFSDAAPGGISALNADRQTAEKVAIENNSPKNSGQAKNQRWY
jgi:hypothetical protein